MEEGIFPFPYWLSALTIVFSSLWFLSKIRLGYGMPALAVLATCTVWYLGDVNYNDYDEYGRLCFRQMDNAKYLIAPSMRMKIRQSPLSIGMGSQDRELNDLANI